MSFNPEDLNNRDISRDFVRFSLATSDAAERHLYVV